jgi:hypothetical protein
MLALFIPLMGIAARNSPIDNLFKKYAHKDGVVTLNIGYIGCKFISFVCNISDAKKEEAEMFKEINGIRLLTIEDKELNKNLNFYKELEAEGFFEKNNYYVLMEVTDKNETVRFFGRSLPEGKFSELVLIVSGHENTVITIRGDIDPKKIGVVTKGLNLDIKAL